MEKHISLRLITVLSVWLRWKLWKPEMYLLSIIKGKNTTVAGLNNGSYGTSKTWKSIRATVNYPTRDAR